MTELLSGVALHWCRQERKNWHTWADFRAAARRCYGVDRRLQRRLKAEVQARTQGEGESVQSYVYCMLTLLSKFVEPWSLEDQLDLLYDNMMPKLQQLIRRSQVTSIDSLIELGRDAEYTLDVERNYRPPPDPSQSTWPELAFKSTKARSHQPRPSLAEMAEANLSRRREKADVPQEVKVKSRDHQPNIAALADTSPEGLAAMIAKILDEKLSKTTDARVAQKPAIYRKNYNSNRGRKNAKGISPSTAVTSQGGNAGKTFSPPQPTSTKNKDKPPPPGPKSFVYCWSCAWPGYIRPTCPECSGKGKGSQ